MLTSLMTLICCFYDRTALELKEWISPLKEERVPVTSSSNDVMQMSTHIEYTHKWLPIPLRIDFIGEIY